jgi:hypothetical protein
MATRGSIIYLNGPTLVATYCHYDSYPKNLGRGLQTFYNEDSKAKEIANVGYISGMDGETGEWDAKRQQPPLRIQLNVDSFEDMIEEIALTIDSMGASWAYMWDTEEGNWITIENAGIRSMIIQLERDLEHLKINTQSIDEEEEASEELNEYNKRQWQYRAGIIK